MQAKVEKFNTNNNTTIGKASGINLGFKKSSVLHSPGIGNSQSPPGDISRGLIVTQIIPQERQPKLHYSSYSPKKVERRRHTTSEVPDLGGLIKNKEIIKQEVEKPINGLTVQKLENESSSNLQISKKHEILQIEEAVHEENEDKQQEYKELSSEQNDFEKSEKENKIIIYLEGLGIRTAIPSEKEKEYYLNNRKNIPYSKRENQLFKNRKTLGVSLAPINTISLTVNSHLPAESKQPEVQNKELEEEKGE